MSKCVIENCNSNEFYSWIANAPRKKLCKTHEKERQRKSYYKHREKILLKDKIELQKRSLWWANKKVNHLKNWDKRKKLKTFCDLTGDEFLALAKECVYCGDNKNVGLDRIDNTMGHDKKNVLPCCLDCNKTRGDRYTVDEFFKLAKVIVEIKNSRSLTSPTRATRVKPT